ncbi:MAG TPA: SCO family protein [Steroidobacteraceae bacterium]|nr:SCO family protein [Steroidobacteraceae bacterium]
MKCGRFLLLMLSGTLMAQPLVRAPPDLLTSVGFDQRLGATVPQQLQFQDIHGASVRLGDLVSRRPTLLVPDYYRCTNVCSVVRAGVADAVARTGLVPGRDFAVLLVSFDPRETPKDAREAQTLDAHGAKAADVMDFQYLSGQQPALHALMASIGFRYRFDPRNGQFAHDVGLVLLMPGGRIAQYFFGAHFQPEALRLGIVSASAGHVGNLVDHFLLLCCDYDVSTGRYSLTVHHLMRWLGIATVVALLLLVILLLRAEFAGRHE